MLDLLQTYLPVAGGILASIIAFLAVIAPLTKSTVDNKVLDILRFVEDKLLSLVLPGLIRQSEVLPAEEAPAPKAAEPVTKL